jgi:hypothetical protein
MLCGISPVSVWRSVDLPEPDGPSSKRRSPGRMAIDTGPTAVSR